MNVETNLMLPEYKSLVDILFENKSPILIPNCSYKHNTIINELILKNTPDNGTIYIFSKHLKKKLFENESFLKEVEQAIKRNIVFHISCVKTCESNKFKDLLKNSIKENVCPLIMEEKNKKYFVEFFTNGTAVSLIKNESDESLTSGNDPKAGKKLISAFKQINNLTF